MNEQIVKADPGFELFRLTPGGSCSLADLPDAGDPIVAWMIVPAVAADIEARPFFGLIPITLAGGPEPGSEKYDVVIKRPDKLFQIAGSTAPALTLGHAKTLIEKRRSEPAAA